MNAFTGIGSVAKIFWKWTCGIVKVVWTLATLIIVGLTATYVVRFFTDTDISHRISDRYVVYKYNRIDRYYIYDNQNSNRSAKWFSSIDEKFGADSLIRCSQKGFFGDNERYGYIDARTGEIAIEPQFYKAGVFSEGMAAVCGENGASFIDTSGKLVLSIEGDVRNIASTTMCNGCAIIDFDRDDACGIMSNKGEWLIEPKYYRIEKTIQDRYIVGTEFYKGLWSVDKGWIVEPKCYELRPYRKDVDGFHIFCEDRSYIIDANGKVINPFVFNYSEILTYKEGESVKASDYVLFAIEDKCYGVYNYRTNKVLLPAKYRSIYMASKDVFVVDDAWTKYFVDKNGKVINPLNVN